MLIDDNPIIISSTSEKFPDKIHVLPDYKCSSYIQKDNVYHFKTTVSDLKDQDFAIAALEMKTRQLEKELQSTKLQRESLLVIRWSGSDIFASFSSA